LHKQIKVNQKIKIMSTPEKKTLTVKATINAPVDKVWKVWTTPDHIIQWNSPSEDWHTPKAENDLKIGGKFTSRMEAKDGSFGFDFEGIYDEVETNKKIAYTMSDGRQATIIFTSNGNKTEVAETFDPENQNSLEMQQAGWQAILDNFKKYTESVDA
jgi:uncharacterized protein YndB with AHSA1/START domain